MGVAHIVQGFQYRPVKNTNGDTIHPIGLVLHVAQGNGSQFNWFNDPQSQASSNLWAGKAGQREQYVPSDVRAWAQAAGNSTYDSVETEGFDTEALTPEQIETVAVAYADGVRTFGWALAVTDTPGQPGLITHGVGKVSWGNHPGCPGTIRAGQRHQIIARAAQIVGGATSPVQPKVVALQHAVHVAADGVWGPVTDAALAEVRTNRHTRAEQAAVGATVDGVWGPLSQAAYVATVRTIQSILGVGVDGVWGPITDQAFAAARSTYFTG
ncbi:N-acetylmuramoyl-L-alanine amidase family 2 protein [Candidatus Protofrankia californiensis]|uniref:N-acetylmuramoyl-L-alanine amidase family 2 protein n=1 Tax=Candidatus Protofrankia californiensis TaxID=1839754 RepID=A0A1C3NUC7_9ACTN|nr:N-acetylmuramoyl-L-alanine amidase family 2 protein [Candidatus Protofrankia californiensis]